MSSELNSRAIKLEKNRVGEQKLQVVQGDAAILRRFSRTPDTLNLTRDLSKVPITKILFSLLSLHLDVELLSGRLSYRIMSLNTFRRLAIRVARTVSRPTLASTAIRPSGVYETRLNSTQTSSTKPLKTLEQLAKKDALEKQDDLQRDWDAKVLPYEEFLPKTQNPSPVRSR